MGKKNRHVGPIASDLDAKFNVHALSSTVQSAGAGARAKGLGSEAVEMVIEQFDGAERRVLAMTGGLNDPRQRAAAKDYKRKFPRYQSAVDILDNSCENTGIMLPSFAEIQKFEADLREHLKTQRAKEASRQGLPSGREIKRRLAMQKAKLELQKK